VRRRHPLPDIWLFTDPRQGDALWPALTALPRGRAGVLFRHYGVPERDALARRVLSVCRARRLAFVDASRAHGRFRGALTAPAHDRRELVAARRAGVALVFLSPVFPTASHPGARTLGRTGFGRLARGAGVPVAALGGMTAPRYSALRPLGAVGWGAIDALTP
jgi:thiamine-phosphate pyrophosphorylase